MMRSWFPVRFHPKPLQPHATAQSFLRQWLLLLWLGCEFHDEQLVIQSQQMTRLLTSGIANNGLSANFLHNARELYKDIYTRLIQQDWSTTHELSIEEWDRLVDARRALHEQMMDAMTDEIVMSFSSLISAISHMLVRQVSDRELRLVDISCQAVSMPIASLQQRVLDVIRSATEGVS